MSNPFIVECVSSILVKAMSEDSVGHEKFLEEVKKNSDCPEGLFKIAKTPFEKLTAIEFFNIHKKIDICRGEIKWLTWLTKSVIIIGVATIAFQIISDVFHL